MRVITVNTVPVELYKILKFEGLVSSGAEAKAAVAEGLVKVNGDIESRKRKKILAGDLIEFGSETLRIVLDDTPQVD
ncbi:MAG: RNA-binding S4 domain-containing protein [Pseudohongiella sp.]|nr:RNA-binding S4 domain-containing protein [Pseudohongiella sp.]